jgi:hypothetical protein
MSDQLKKQLAALMRSPQANQFYQMLPAMQMLKDYRAGNPLTNPASQRPPQFLPQQPGMWSPPVTPMPPPPVYTGGSGLPGGDFGGPGGGDGPTSGGPGSNGLDGGSTVGPGDSDGAGGVSGDGTSGGGGGGGSK